MKKIIILVLIFLATPYYVKANIICNDGTVSASCGDCHRGCCSRHGGCSNSQSTSSSNTSSNYYYNGGYNSYSNSDESASSSSQNIVDNNNYNNTDTSSNEADNISDELSDDSSDDSSTIGGIITIAAIAGTVYAIKKGKKKKVR